MYINQNIKAMFKYFTIGEMVRSTTAERRKIDNKLPKAYLPNVINLIEKVLDPLREAYGKPIIINSGYRCEKLNEVVNGSPTSDHMFGRAADIHGTPNNKVENRKLFNLIQSLDLPFDQLINECNYSWIHVSLRPDGENRHQILVIR